MNEIIWLIVGLTVLFTVCGGLMCLSDDRQTREGGMKMLAGWWGGMTAVIAVTLAMTFVIKPFLAWFFGLF